MARQALDLYGTLGVEQKATQEEIKKAFRRLSRSLHPDVNKAEDAQERFEEVKHAYEILGDEKLRKEYDEFLKSQGGAKYDYNYEFKDVFDMFFRRPRTAFDAINGDNITAKVNFSITEVLRGEEKTIFIKSSRLCPDCKGKRFIIEDKTCCVHCEGMGKISKTILNPFGQINTSDICPVCKGTGYAKAKPCSTCEEGGLIPDDVKFTFVMPEDVVDGKVVVLKGKGQPGRNGGANGNLTLIFQHQIYDRFKIEHEFDVVGKVTIGLKEALLGGTVQVVHPDGIEREVEIPSKTQSGSRVSIQDMGLLDKSRNYRGNFYVEFNVQYPYDLTIEQVSQLVKTLEMKGGK